MRILMVTPELAPVVKVGGLADVVGALAKALKALGHDVRIILPRYRGLRWCEDMVPNLRPLVVHLGRHDAYARLWEGTLPGSEVPLYLVEHNDYFDSTDVYAGPTGNEAESSGYRFSFFARAALDACTHLDWVPDIFHCHDWPTGLLPVYLNTTEAGTALGKASSVLTLHNMQHQGWFHKSVLDYAGLPASTFRPDCLESFGELNFLKGGLYNANKLTTVSPTYAAEIQGPAGGCGLHNLLRFRAGDLIGILNGIDPSEWDPAKDPLLKRNFSADDLSGKAECKQALQNVLGLEVLPDCPVFGVVSRLVDQKGLDLLAECAPRVLRDMRVQIALIGSGDPVLERAFTDLAKAFPGRVGTHIGFDNTLAHGIIGGADFLLMPSRFEPCGLSQIYAMLYGTPPVARATGGLIDTICNYREGSAEGTGFLFSEATPRALYDTIGWACSTYYDRPEGLAAIQQAGMRSDFTWDRSAEAYAKVYRWAMK